VRVARINRSFSAHEFVLTPAFSLDGRAITETGSLAGLSGSAITACNPSVGLPSADD
jgi:hypothetical protein